MPFIASLCFKPSEKKLQIYVVFIIMDLGGNLRAIRDWGSRKGIKDYMEVDNFVHANGSLHWYDCLFFCSY